MCPDESAEADESAASDATDNANESSERDVLDTAAYVRGSRYRELAVTALSEGPRQPSQIADGSDVARSHVSRALSELSSRDVVREHSSDSRAKLYSLTDLGSRVADQLPDSDP